MILNINGNLNRYYAQTLCMLFFPGATFGEKEARSPENPEITFTVIDLDSEVSAQVIIKIGDSVSIGRDVAVRSMCSSRADLSKIAAGHALFNAGKSMLGYTPPWGILTGIRPAKTAAKYLSDGLGILQTKRILRDEYFTNPKKAALAVSVASNEAKLLKKLEPNLCSMYISIPFCPSRCAYCSFVSYTSHKLLSLIDEYLDVLCSDIESMVRIINETGLKLATIYIGGGTPTVLDNFQLEKLLSIVEKCVDVSSLMEFTLESGRPDTITEEKLKIAKAHGVTRVSVNPQTLSDEILGIIGRKHTCDDFYSAYDIARRSGIRDINVDIIAGLPGDNYHNFSNTVDRITELSPTNITVHTFCVKKASDVLRSNTNIYSPHNDDTAKCVEYSQLKTKLTGYKPYYIYKQKNTVGNLENVGYAREGHEGYYNIFMMEEIHPIFAVGAGSVTKLVHNQGVNEKIHRIFAPKYPYEYLREAKDDAGVGNREAALREKILAFFVSENDDGKRK
ncbi:MAG: coproporphyrinogen dehydrogenase HemZ [Eubacteriales bacterium]|nr:coproporphyrinogen dehydrogenase HemZ [Eubacteriales bacterium]